MDEARRVASNIAKLPTSFTQIDAASYEGVGFGRRALSHFTPLTNFNNSNLHVSGL